ncbi:nodal homolog 2-A-like [Pyxicephalus adspersus]|uniref:nodal homolog 2-A-like n=1 Tax=Pyxicephalus adspersus TaxID=30357 RepID=UPI003B5AFCCE
MTWLNSILYLTALSMVQGLPPFLQGNQSTIPLQLSNHGLRTSRRPGQAYSHNMKSSPFMMEFYQTLLMGNGTGLSNLEQSVLQDSDTVLSLTAKRCTKMDNHRSLYFDMSSLSSNNEIQLAELRIHLLPSEETQDMTLQIYHSKEDSGRLLLGSVHTDSLIPLGGFWKVLNLTKILNTYLHTSRSFNDEDFMKEKSSPQRDHENSCTDISTDRVVLMVFTKDRPSTNINGHLNFIQTVKSSKYVMSPKLTSEQGISRHKKTRNLQLHIRKNKYPTNSIENGKSLCLRVNMMINVDKFEWGDAVIFPKIFNAYRCEGACPIPLSESFNPTPHAFIMSLAKLYNTKHVGCLSCAPVKMRRFAMLVHEGDKVVMKYHNDMIVEECGCQ